MAKTPFSDSAFATLSKSKHYFVTSGGFVIPLLAITGIDGIDAQPAKEDRFDVLRRPNKIRDARIGVPPSSLMVSTNGKEFFVTPAEVPAFLSKLAALG